MFTVDFRFEENQTTIEFPCNEEFLSAKFDELGVEDKLKTSQYMIGTNYAALKRLVTDFADTDERIKDLKTLNYKYGIAIFEYVDMLDAAARKEPYNNNEVRFKADAKEVFYSIQHLLYVWICHLNHIIKVENFLLIFPLVILRLGTFSAFCTMKFHCNVNIFPFFRI